ncbi:MAG: hypothetical protein IJO32_05825 [Bacilli bacterium]|nr:hypothetical protein [Bacilli bacterium]
MKKITIIFLVFVSCFTGCQNLKKVNYDGNTIGSIAYNYNKELGYTIYLIENNKYVPFLVIHNYDNNKTLLLRKNTLIKPKKYNEVYDELYPSYYKNSDINNFLNNEYYSSLDTKIQKLISCTNIEITSKDSLEIHGNKIESMNTFIFLLSTYELGYGLANTATKEGIELDFFKNPNNRLALDDSGKKSSYWLRTPDTGYSSAPYIVAQDGKIGSINAYDEDKVRPAFIVASDTKIKKEFVNELDSMIFIFE